MIMHIFTYIFVLNRTLNLISKDSDSDKYYKKKNKKKKLHVGITQTMTRIRLAYDNQIFGLLEKYRT